MPANTKNSLEILKVDASDFLTALNGSQIDNKIDDGKPSDGKVYGVNSHGSLAIVRADGTTVARGDCINNYNSTEAKYNLPLTDTGITRMYFYLPE